MQCDHSHLSRAKFKNQWSYTSTQRVSMAQSDTTLLYLNLLSIYISLNRSHPFWSYKGTFLHITHPLHAHYMNHLSHLYWSNYINIMKSFNNEPHYIIFCVLLLLTPSISQKFSWQLSSHSSSKHVTPSVWEVTFYTHIKLTSDLLMDETFHCKWYCTCSESQNKGFFS